MYFIISKLLVIFIYPFTWILALLLFALFNKNKKYKYRSLIAAITLTVVFTNPFLLNKFAYAWDTPPYKSTLKKHYSCAIILGGFSSSNGLGAGYFNSGSDRFLQGVKLMLSNQTSHLLISGGNGSLMPGGFSEALWVKREAKEFNFPDSAILIESTSRNTLENARFSKQLLEKSNLAPPYLLVTSAFHMPRSLMIFKKMGVNVIPYPANYITRREIVSAGDFLPAVEVLSNWNIYIKEVVGYVANSF